MPNKKKILVVDDENALRNALVDSLKSEEMYEIFSAADGEEALASIHKEHPDLVLLDISMPKMDGIALARRLSDEKLLGTTKIIFLTNATDIGQIATATEAGNTDYLIKADWDMTDIIKHVKEKLV